jgi:hypothetical protein
MQFDHGTLTTTQVYNNIVNINMNTPPQANFSSVALSVRRFNQLDLRNNILINKSTAGGTNGKSVAFHRQARFSKATHALTSNKNIFFVNNGLRNALLRDSLNNATSICALIDSLGQGRESGSQSEDVVFQSTNPSIPGFMKPSVTVATAVENAGIPLALVTTDIEGNSRSSTTPDIGAFEDTYTPKTSGTAAVDLVQQTSSPRSGDANVLALRIELTPSTSSGTQVTAFNLNTAGTTLATRDIAKARIMYTRESTTYNPLTAVQFGADFNNPNGAFSISGNELLTCQSKKYYFWLVYDLKCSALSTDVIDGEVSSIDYTGGTITPTATNPTGTQSITVPTALAGTYNIPTNYATLDAAITDLNSKGLSSSVTFAVSSTHVERAPANGYLIDIGNLCWDTTRASRSITIKPAGTGRPIIYAQNNGTATPATTASGSRLDGVFTLRGADWITIDSLEIRDTNTIGNSRMEYMIGLFKKSGNNGARFNTFRNNLIVASRQNIAVGNSFFGNGSKAYYIGSTGFNDFSNEITPTDTFGLNSYNKFMSNDVQNVYTPVWLEGFNGFSTGVYDRSNSIMNNSFTNWGGGTAA